MRTYPFVDINIWLGQPLRYGLGLAFGGSGLAATFIGRLTLLAPIRVDIGFLVDEEEI
jgi:hypothetical protein